MCDTETTGKPTSLSSVVAVRDTARGHKAKNHKHGCGKPGTKRFSRPLCLNTGEPALAGFVGPSSWNYSRGSKCKQQSHPNQTTLGLTNADLQVPVMDWSA